MLGTLLDGALLMGIMWGSSNFLWLADGMLHPLPPSQDVAKHYAPNPCRLDAGPMFGSICGRGHDGLMLWLMGAPVLGAELVWPCPPPCPPPSPPPHRAILNGLFGPDPRAFLRHSW